MRVDFYKDTVIARGGNINKFINSRRFHFLRDLGEQIYEVKLHKKTVRWKLPLQIGFAIYNLAKLELLKICFSVLLKFIHPRDYAIACCDTDSLYFGISKDTFTEAIDPAMRDVFHKEKARWFPRTKCALHEPSQFDINDDCLKPPSL